MDSISIETVTPLGTAVYLQDSTLRVADAASVAHIKAIAGIALAPIPAGTVLEKRADGYYLDGQRVIAARPVTRDAQRCSMPWCHRLLLRYWRWRVKHGGTQVAQQELERYEHLASLERAVEEQTRRMEELQRRADEREA